jgi:hypothetical protein
MPRQNRVRPDGRLVATPERGLFWGNRGPLLDRAGELARYSRGRNWIICVLEFKGRHRTVWTPGRLTELFFLDEATGLAAGHRPCGECRSADYRRFKEVWSRALPDEPATAPGIDARLHADRLQAPGRRRTYVESVAALPDGAMITLAGEPWLVHGPDLLEWTFGGYRRARPRSAVERAEVLTPQATVAVLRAGYRPELHPTARDPRVF